MNVFNHHNFLIYSLIIFIILIIGCVIGLVITPYPETPINLMNSNIYDLTTIQMFEQILTKNIIATFLIISLGVIGFRIIPTICILFNGYTMGNMIVLLKYDPIVLSIIFPHGYIEFPILIFTGVCSYIIAEELHKTGLNIFTLVTHHGNPNVRPILKNYLLYPYILIILPGILLSTIIESTFTVWNLRILIGV